VGQTAQLAGVLWRPTRINITFGLGGTKGERKRRLVTRHRRGQNPEGRLDLKMKGGKKPAVSLFSEKKG